MADLRTIADWNIRQRLLSIGGVAQVTVMGGDIKEYQIQLKTARMKHYGVSMDEVIAAVNDMNLNAPGGTIYQHGNEYIVRGLLSTDSLEEMRSALVKQTESGYPITLDDIAEVKIGSKTPKLGVAAECKHN